MKILDKLKLVVKYNATLFIRNAAGKKSMRIHGLSVALLIVLSYAAFTWIFLSEVGKEDMPYLLVTIMFVIVVVYILMGALLITAKYTDYGRSISPRNLLLLPLSSSRLFLMILGDLFLNVNTLCFLGASAIILASVPTAGIFFGLITLGIPLLFSIIVTICAANLYVLSAKYFIRNKQLVMMIPFMLFFSVQILMQVRVSENGFKEFITSPAVVRILSGILFAVNRDWMRLGISAAILMLTAVAGLVVGQVLIRRFRHNLAG